MGNLSINLRTSWGSSSLSIGFSVGLSIAFGAVVLAGAGTTELAAFSWIDVDGLVGVAAGLAIGAGVVALGAGFASAGLGASVGLVILG